MTRPQVGYLLPTRDWVVLGDREPFALIEQARLAEDLGFDSVWAGDSPVTRHRADALMLLSAVAAVTERVTLGTAVLLPALRHPILLAHQLATLDRIADGRLIAGMGAGFPHPNTEAQFDALGIAFKRRVSRTEESIDVMRQLWAGGAVSYQGAHFDFRDVMLEPEPAQVGGPPIWLAGSGASALRRVGRLADGWLPYPPTSETYAQEWGVVQETARLRGPASGEASYVGGRGSGEAARLGGGGSGEAARLGGHGSGEAVRLGGPAPVSGGAVALGARAAGDASLLSSSVPGEVGSMVEPAVGEGEVSAGPAAGEMDSLVGTAVGEADSLVGPAMGEAGSLVGPAAGEGVRVITPALYATVCLDDDPERARDRLRTSIERYYNAPLEFIETIQATFAGSAADAVDWLNAYTSAGMRHVVIRFAVDDHRAALEEFADRVLPRLRAEVRP
ncbi:LLM class flavin-dependent oxidoreductase [Nonomuraea aurantiaca]|uniref:LLM class flavin-dependent oxidoreductase n=1 Tax=Nonomuraea aurantiaca TaxID=2878562 RepID=UPI001CD9AA6C|nr:LLM class flavin-dependent oxidoreductase [Nonomuraea aurantiaca]MCA2224658.1 TIGR03619 family F420-dependent LLM class oxidoreductase [Nonomuraea aurantiaca]